MLKHVHLGFAVGTGESIEVPMRNLAVTGQTQESGKTTTLEALVSRANVPAIAFVTKRGEGAFSIGNRLKPYFRERADWQFVSSLIDATLREKNKFLRAWIMKLCRTTTTLRQVHDSVRRELKKASGIEERVYTELDHYLDLIVPVIESAPLAKTMTLGPGLNVMDVGDYSTPMQMLFVQSAIDWVNANARDTITIVPEAWEFIPEGKGSPVKASAEALVRKGSGIGNYIWIDSQDMAGVDKTILRGCPVWIIGVQREANEIKRNLANIPAGIKKPTAADIAGLDRGQFYACWKDRTTKVYVQPAWMESSQAQRIAMGILVPTIPTGAPPKPREEEVKQEEADQLRADNDRLRSDNAKLRADNTDLIRRIETLEKRPQVPANQTTAASSNTQLDVGAVYDEIKRRLIEEAPALLKVLDSRPELQIAVRRQVIQVDGESTRGRIAKLIAENFFASSKTSADVASELGRRGFNLSNIELGNELKALTQMGFFTRDNKWISLVPDMKVNVIEE